MTQTSARSMGQTMTAFKPGATMPAASMGAAMGSSRSSGDAFPMGSPRAAVKGNLPAAVANAGSALSNGMVGDMSSTMSSTGSRDSRAKFLRWFNSLSPRQGQTEQELPHLEHSRYQPLLFSLFLLLYAIPRVASLKCWQMVWAGAASSRSCKIILLQRSPFHIL